jgi:hypothetical protein
MGDRRALIEKIRRDDPRFDGFFREYLAAPPDPADLPASYATLPLLERAIRHALGMCRFPPGHPIFWHREKECGMGA